MIAVLSVLTALVAVVDWWAVAEARPSVEAVVKPLTMVGLLAVAEAAGAGSHAAGVWLLVALFFGMLGDVALLGSSASRFVSGVALFLVGHLAYVVCFLELWAPKPGLAWAVSLFLVAVLVVTRDTVPSAFRLGGARVAGPVAAYSLVIGAMLIMASLTGRPLLALGAAIFVVSDSIIGLSIARRGFAGPAGRTHVVVMVTYHVGQALIAASVLRALA